jgi:hypothetical protein
MSNRVKSASDHDAILVIAIGVIVLALGLFAKYVLWGH